MSAILKRIFDLFSAFFAGWIIVAFVKFLFTHRYGWIGWVAIAACIFEANMFADGTWFGIEETTYYNHDDTNTLEYLLGLNF
jgi:hypothetical protein